MDPWIIGLIVLVFVGLGVIIFGALSDRNKNRRAAQQIQAPPERGIPRFAPDAPAPHYLSQLQARRRPETAESTNLTQSERTEVERQLAAATTAKIEVGYRSKGFVTDPQSGWAVLEHPYVLVCANDVTTIRELLTVLEKLILSKERLVVVAPGMTTEVVETLEVNAIQGTMGLLALVTAEPTLKRIAEVTGATLMGRSDLQASYVLPEHLGRCDRWVSSRDTSWIIGSAAPPRPLDSDTMDSDPGEHR